MAQINKIVVGYVIQVWDTELNAFTSQDFYASDGEEYEDAENGDPITVLPEGLQKTYLNLEMIQPSLESEPSLGGAGDKLRWIRWYRKHHRGVSLKDAIEVYEERMDEQMRAEHGIVS